MGNPPSKNSFKNSSLNNQFNFVNSDQFQQREGKQQDRSNEVFTKFIWTHGGRNVLLTGSFNDWKKSIPMDRNGEEFSVTLLLPRQVHQYKFIVDGHWCFSPEDTTMPDSNGHINNFIDTTNYEPIMKYRQQEKKLDQSGLLFENSKGDTSAPKLPLHLEFCLYLGDIKKTPMNSNKHHKEGNYESLLTDEQIQHLFKTPHCLPVPTHVTLNHLMTCQDQIFDIMAATKRCKQKYTTYKYFSVKQHTVSH